MIHIVDRSYNEQRCTVCKKNFYGASYEDICQDCFNKAISKDTGKNRWYTCPACKGINSKNCPRCKGWGVIHRGKYD